VTLYSKIKKYHLRESPAAGSTTAPS
jgi:hypothetical protein